VENVKDKDKYLIKRLDALNVKETKLSKKKKLFKLLLKLGVLMNTIISSLERVMNTLASWQEIYM
jgi:hypothetical protein